jgi:Fe-Mn family superoxide dismutase
MKFEIPDLPFDKDALTPHVSPRTLDYHYEKHHKGYLEKLRKATDGRPQADMSLEELIRSADGGLFNNAAQVWNHSFYWQSLSPSGGGTPHETVSDEFSAAFGSVESFKHRFAEAANGQFGSGWAWLVLDADDQMRVVSSSDAENPIRSGDTPLLTLDVWEHAYYLDVQNDRNAYVERFLDHLVNWEFVQKNLDEARATDYRLAANG